MIKTVKFKHKSKIRLDKFLKLNFTILTQSYIEKNIRKKNILVNNLKSSSNYLLNKNDVVKILNFHPESYKNKVKYKKKIIIEEKDLKLFKKSIIFENQNFIILNKWSGISTQGGSKIKLSVDDIIKSISDEYRLVHRLDRETSGLLIISKNYDYAKIFGKLFKENLITKNYVAICQGKPNLNESYVNLDILDNKKNKKNKTSTYYKTLNYSHGFSQIFFQPMTGKTHQLRIVSKNLSCPIVGDKLYNVDSKFKNEALKLNAHILKFKINKNYNFHSIIPKDFSNFIKKNRLKKFENLIY